jgi:chemotaxis protein histidine kinase CheA
MPKYLTAREIREKFEVVFSTHQTDALTEVMSAVEAERVAEMAEIRENLTTLVEVTTRLAQAQQRTDESVKGLAQAQTRTEARVGELVQAQTRTEARVEELAQAQKELAQAQTRTEARVEELAQAQKELAQAQTRTEARVEELAQAQARTEQVVAETRADILQMREQLTRTEARIVELQQAVGRIGNDLGYDLEEYTSLLLPPYLERHFGIHVNGLGVDHFLMDDGSRAEVDLVGHATRDGQPLLLLGECRVHVGGGAIGDLADKLDAIARTMPNTKLFKYIVGMRIHPTAPPVAQARGIELIPYSNINRERG